MVRRKQKEFEPPINADERGSDRCFSSAFIGGQ
jgi:hypothetical protein